MIELLKAVLFGIVEGITEWLPVSSTGHIILLDEFVRLNVTPAFNEMFEVVIQLGAILAVVLLFFHKLNPFSPQKDAQAKKATWSLWAKVVVSILPSGILGVLLDDWMNDQIRGAELWGMPLRPMIVALALIVYGVVFIFMERINRGKKGTLESVYDIDYRTAILIGCFQCLSLIPGTSRSGSTILGAILLGVGRSAGAEFSFFMAIPTMLGASALKLLKYLAEGITATGSEIAILLIGCIVSFVVSLFVIRALMEYVRKHSFAAFGVYRIVLGAVVLVYFLLT